VVNDPSLFLICYLSFCIVTNTCTGWVGCAVSSSWVKIAVLRWLSGYRHVAEYQRSISAIVKIAILVSLLDLIPQLAVYIVQDFLCRRIPASKLEALVNDAAALEGG